MDCLSVWKKQSTSLARKIKFHSSCTILNELTFAFKCENISLIYNMCYTIQNCEHFGGGMS